ncbi:hypothetical protein [Streptomyces sp. NPDC048637]|uniref:hypothetical protein n=1 Tax=Streptomyces sp. NPDC048637 TaxID=3155636 RepID=UPI00342C6924
MAGDEQIPSGPVPQRVHRLPDVPWHIAADIHDRVPTALAQRRVVAGVPVTDEPGQPGEQLPPGPPPAEQGHFGAGAQGIIHDGAAHERRPAQYQKPHASTLATMTSRRG